MIVKIQDSIIQECYEVRIKSKSQTLNSYAPKNRTQIYQHKSKKCAINIIAIVIDIYTKTLQPNTLYGY